MCRPYLLFLSFFISVGAVHGQGGFFTFTNYFNQSVIRIGGSGLDGYWDFSPTARGQFRAEFPLRNVTVSTFNASTPFEVSIGSYQFVGTLGDSSTYSPGGRTASFTRSATDSSGTERVMEKLVLTWTDTELKITGSSTNANNQIYNGGSYSGQATAFTDDIQVSVTLGDFSLMKRGYVKGKNALRTQTVGRGDAAETFELNKNTASGQVDFVLPTIGITAPLARARVFDPQLIVTGRTADNVEVYSVRVRVGDEFTGEEFVAEGTSEWSAEVTLRPGTNVLSAFCFDASDNQSLFSRRSIVYVVTNAITLQVDGSGSVTGVTNGQPLEIGRNYSVTAKPGTNYLFSHWSVGSTERTNPTLSFLMESNLVLQAHFVTNPFIATKGIYNGLFYPESGVNPTNSGFVTVTVSSLGAFSGKIILEGATNPISGQFDLNGAVQKKVLRGTKAPLWVSLNLGEVDEELHGIVSVSNAWQAPLIGLLAHYSGNPEAGLYNFILPPDGSSSSPAGYSYGTINMATNGTARLTTFLADGTSFNQNLGVSKDGQLPLFATLYSGKGAVAGWITFTNELNTDLRGDNVTWTKLPSATRLFATGFTNVSTLLGSRYVAPAPGTRLFNWQDGELVLTGGNLNPGQTNAFTVSTNNVISFSDGNTNKASVTLMRATGLFSGTFSANPGKPLVPIKGALLPKLGIGAGYFLGTNQSGAVQLRAD